MNRKLICRNCGLTFVLTLFLHLCFGQLSKTPTFYWMVLSKENKTPSFIFGTIHTLSPKLILNNKQLMNIILQSKLIVQEADTSELLHATNEEFDYTIDTPLDELLGFTDYQYVKNEFLQATGKDLEEYKFQMPIVIMNMIEDGISDKNIYKEKKPMMENAFYALSIVKKIPVQGLETKQDMFNIMFKGMPLIDQAKLLMYDLKELRFNDIEESMKVCFEKQDLTCFCEINDTEHYTRPGDSTMIIKRNMFWMSKIEKHIEQGNVFIAVGAAHLCGNFGVISLLKKDGYTIVPILTQ